MAQALQAVETDDTRNAANRPAVWLCLLAVYLIWGSTYLAIRIAVHTLPPYGMAGSRFVLAGCLLYGFLRLRGARNPARDEWLGGGIVGILLLVGGMGTVSFSEQWVPSSMAALLVSTTPLWAAIFGTIWGRRPGRWEIVGLALGIAGVALLNANSDLGPHPWIAGLILGGSMLWALGSLLSHHVSMPNGMMSSAVEMLVGGVALLCVSAVRGEHIPTTFHGPSVLAFFYLVTIGSLVAFSAYVYLLDHVRPVLATSYAYVNPVVAVLLGVLLAGEHITPKGILALFVIVAAVVLTVLASQTP